jgi:hypothetical protein
MSYVGNCSSVIDWNSIVKELDLYEGTFRGFETPYEKQVTIDLVNKKEHLEYDYLRDNDELNKAYSDNKSLEFYTYTAGKEYSKDIDYKFAEWLGVDVSLSWISKVGVGKVAAPHIDDEEVYWSKNKFPNRELVRYHCHITQPEMGAAFMIEKECYHMKELGDVFIWPSTDSLHCGVNASTKEKFLYHFIGVKK